MNSRDIAKVLGRRGGRARAKRLTADERRHIAALGAHARRESREAAQRIADNFRSLDAVRDLQGEQPRVKRLKRAKHPLPRVT